MAMAAAILPSVRLHGIDGRQLKPAAATSVLALLDEDDAGLKEHGLRKLKALVDVHWAEAAEFIPQIEALAEDASFSGAQLAAAVASKVYYHLESYTDAVRLALAAGPFFDVSTRDEYTDTIVSRCIDEYTASRQTGGATPVDPRLESIVNRMFTRCWEDASWRQALGIALEARRLDVVSETAGRALKEAAGASYDGAPLPSSSAGADFLAYAVDLVTGVTPYTPGTASLGVTATGISFPREFRSAVLRALLLLYSFSSSASASTGTGNVQVFDPLTHARLLLSLGEEEGLAHLLINLVKEGCARSAGDDASSGSTGGGAASEDAEMAGSSTSSGATGAPSTTPESASLSSPEVLLAYQVALDVVEGDDQVLLTRLHQRMPAAATPATPATSDAAAATGGGSSEASSSSSSLSPAESTAFHRLRLILDGSLTTAIHADVLSHKHAGDFLLLKKTKDAVDPRNSVLHNAIVNAHAAAYCGTSVDKFLRDNLDWLSRAANWAKFSASASQGVLYRGRLQDAKQLLESFLPREGEATGDPYSEGGALFALGLVHANRGAAEAAGVVARPSAIANPTASASASSASASGFNVVQYLLGNLRTTQHAVLQHGACLGLGTAAMGSGDQEAYAAMREVVFSAESASAGEGAALGIGLLLAGRGGSWVSEATGESAADELLGHAHDSDKEKTVRGIGMALALQCYGCEEGANVVIDELCRDKDAVLRYGGMFAIGLAYCGTGSNAAVRRLLHVAVSDVSDDVRRAAVMALGFVLCRQWRELPSLVAHLSESYNPHVRYGAALAIGIACAGSGLPEAVGILEPLLADSADYVRQGALLALGLVLQQESGAHLPKAAEIREKVAKIIADKHSKAITRMGAILCQGLLDAGGRNAITSMVSRGGFVRMGAAVGMALWLQHWYWYPLLNFLSLAQQPTIVVGITQDFKVATAFTLSFSCPKSWFDYPPMTSEEKKDAAAGVTTMELSISAKARAKQAAKDKEKAAKQGGGAASASGGAAGGAGGKMEVDDAATATTATAGTSGGAAGGAQEGSETTSAAGGAGAEKSPAAVTATGKKEKEEPTHTVTAPCRVTLGQARFLDWNAAPVASQRYQPVRVPTGTRLGSGILLVQDTKPEAGPDASLKPVQPPRAAAGEGDEGPEPLAPAAFEWVVGNYY